MKTEKFDWHEYYEFAKSCEDYKNEAKLRNGISKFYNSAFCLSRDFLIENKMFLNKQSKKKRMTTGDSLVHQETRNIFENHKELNSTGKGRKIATKLNSLRIFRNHVYYDNVIPYDINYLYKRSKFLSESIIKLLDEIN